MSKAIEPKRAKFVSYGARLYSFYRFPTLSPARPAILAAAGFCSSRCFPDSRWFFDSAECFHCGLQLHAFKRDECIVRMHADRSPDCPFAEEQLNKLQNSSFVGYIETIVDQWMQLTVVKKFKHSFKTSNSILRNTIYRRIMGIGTYYKTVSELASECHAAETRLVQEVEMTRKKGFKRFKFDPDALESRKCLICKEKGFEAAVSPCGHVFSCLECASSEQTCAYCGMDVAFASKIFISV